MRESKDEHNRTYYGKPLPLLNYLRRTSTVNLQGNYKVFWYLGNGDEVKYTYIAFNDEFNSEHPNAKNSGEKGFKELIHQISEYYKNQE